VTLKLAVSNSRPSVPYGANTFFYFDTYSSTIWTVLLHRSGVETSYKQLTVEGL